MNVGKVEKIDERYLNLKLIGVQMFLYISVSSYSLTAKGKVIRISYPLYKEFAGMMSF